MCAWSWFSPICFSWCVVCSQDVYALGNLLLLLLFGPVAGGKVRGTFFNTVHWLCTRCPCVHLAAISLCSELVVE